MTKPKWTNGPWKVSRGAQNDPYSIEGPTRTVAHIKSSLEPYRDSIEITIANARLIAQAPEMAKELSSVVLTLDRLAQSWPLADMVSVVKELADHRATILAILAKIEGLSND